MDFKELLARYEAGETTAEEAAFVEEELEKYRLLTDYVVEHDDPAPPGGEPGAVPDGPSMKGVRRAARAQRVGIILAAALVVCVLLAALGPVYRGVLLPLINRVGFLNPETQSILDEGPADLHLAMGIFEEVYHPGCATVMVHSKTTGPWRYDLSVYRYNMLSDTPAMDWLDGTLDKGTLTLGDGFQTVWASSLFTRDDDRGRAPWGGRNPERVRAELKALPGYVEAYLRLSFDRDLSMEELAALMEEHPGADVFWVGVRAGQSVAGMYCDLGFNPSGLNFSLDGPIQQYPYLMVGEHKDEDRAAVFSGHFKALMRFQADHGALMGTVAGAGLATSPFGKMGETMLAYVEEAGVNTYGIYVRGYAADLLPLCEQDYVEEIAVERLDLSLDTWGSSE